MLRRRKWCFISSTDGGQVKKFSLIAAIFIVVALLFTPLTALAAGSAQITRTFEASANAAVAGGDNNGFETTPTNAYADDSTFAVDAASGKNNNADPVGGGTDKHNFYNFGMDTIPSTSGTINGITVRADIAVSSTADSPFTAIRLSWDGGTTWTTVIQQTLTNTAETTYTYGGAADTWGRTWSASELTDASFRVQVINGDLGAGSTTDFSLDYIAVSITFTPVWDSYSDTARNNNEETFTGGLGTVYMEGTGFWSNATAQTYNIAYYDGGGTKIATDAGIALVNVVSDRGDLGNTADPWEPTYTFTTNQSAQQGLWHALVQPTGATTFDTSYSTVSANPDTYDLIADDNFTVNQDVIPEFSTVMAAIGVAGMCFGIYWWMRKRAKLRAG